MNEVEQKRKLMQDALDALKTQKERNSMGQFSTPYPLALEIMRYMRNLLKKKDVSFIEPSIGTGVFYSAFLNESAESTKRVLGFEIDSHYYNPTKKFWKETPLELRQANFLDQEPDDLFDMLVANPPYVRHHHIDSDKKVQLQEKVLKKYGIKISGLAGLYCYFMILSSAWLNENGLSCWLVPSEFMDVNYGTAVKKFLLHNVELVHIHRFNANDLQFADALVSSCIVVFRNRKPQKSSKIKFSIGGTINKPNEIRLIDGSNLKAESKWTSLFQGNVVNLESQVTLGSFFTVKRGIATGDNDFFIVDKETIEKYEIPHIFLRPVLPSPRYIDGNCISSENGNPVVSHPQFLFSCNLPEAIIQKNYPKVWEYIKFGIEKGVPKGYICSHRNPWYSCEDREPAAIVIPYMGRSESQNKMFRFILNKSKAITTNVYLLLYPKPEYAYCLKNVSLLYEIWQKLNSISTETLCQNGRFYGGGLHKMEPKELMRTPANEIATLLEPKSNGQLSLFATA